MVWKVLVDDRTEEDAIELISDFSDIVLLSEYDDKEDLQANIAKFDALLIGGYPIDRAFLEEARNLKVISKRGVGVTKIDIDAASDCGIVVCNTPGANAQAVTEHTWALILAVKKHIVRLDQETRAGLWRENREEYKNSELKSNVLGLYGCGDIGQRVGQVAKSFGMECIAFDPYVNEQDLRHDIRLVDSLDELFSRSDILSIHVILTDETHHSISHDAFDALPADAVVVNTSRGPVVDEKALAVALEEENILGAGLDVFESEPATEDHPLFELDNVVVTSHMGGATTQSDYEKSMHAARNIKERYEGRMPKSALNVSSFIDF